MRRRWLVGTLAALTLALLGGVATRAQKPSSPTMILSEPAPVTPRDAQPKGWRSAGEPPKMVADDLIPGGPPSRNANQAVDDPIGAVDSFLQKSQKEAGDNIRALTVEAASLRARLEKVEAALKRWQGVSQALDQQPSSDGKTWPNPQRWEQPKEPFPQKIEGGMIPPPMAVPVEPPTQLEIAPALPPAPAPTAKVPAEPATLPDDSPAPPPVPSLPSEPSRIPPK